jgi:NTE family protein
LDLTAVPPRSGDRPGRQAEPPAGRRADAVFQGGGVKGIALVGAAAAMEDAGYRWVNLAGTSAGAIVAALLAAGYPASRVGGWLRQIDLPALGGRAGSLREGWNLLFHDGLHSPEGLEGWLRERLAAAGVRRFGDLVLEEFARDPRYRWRLQVVVSDVTRAELVVLPRDAARYGLDPDGLDVARAVRWSASVPFFYTPGRLGASVVVDGGLYSNFPVWLFDCPGDPPWPTFGFRLVGPGRRAPAAIGGPLSFLRALAAAWLDAEQARYLAEPHQARTVDVPDLGVGTVQFDLPPQERLALYRAGYAAAEAFLARWDFDAYRLRYRR